MSTESLSFQERWYRTSTWYSKVDPATPRARAKQQPGPKPKCLENRVYKVQGPIQRVKRSYSREKKIEVLMFLIHHRLPKDSDEDNEIEYRCPTGITLPINGSQDHQLQIKGIPASDSVIGDGGLTSPAPTDPALDIELETFYHSIPASGDDSDAFEYTWVIEDYVHTITPSAAPPR
ncbi:hypothetical protein EV426DRAFT_718824 [Tirmania nivea]|nr:hypothetical protein EV426DRAFT_718824 [Tirmania nivea]